MKGNRACGDNPQPYTRALLLTAFRTVPDAGVLQKKTTRLNTPVFNRVGLLGNGPPELMSGCHLSRHPTATASLTTKAEKASSLSIRAAGTSETHPKCRNAFSPVHLTQPIPAEAECLRIARYRELVSNSLQEETASQVR